MLDLNSVGFKEKQDFLKSLLSNKKNLAPLIKDMCSTELGRMKNRFDSVIHDELLRQTEEARKASEQRLKAQKFAEQLRENGLTIEEVQIAILNMGKPAKVKAVKPAMTPNVIFEGKQYYVNPRGALRGDLLLIVEKSGLLRKEFIQRYAIPAEAMEEVTA